MLQKAIEKGSTGLTKEEMDQVTKLALSLGDSKETDEVVQASIRRAHIYRIPTLKEINYELYQACDRAVFDIFVPDNVNFSLFKLVIDHEKLFLWEAQDGLSQLSH